LDRLKAGAEAGAPADAEAAADVREKIDIDVAEHAGADEIHLRADQLLGDARPQLQRAGQMLALHDLLHRERGSDVQRNAGVVPFAVTRRAFARRRPPPRAAAPRRAAGRAASAPSASRARRRVRAERKCRRRSSTRERPPAGLCGFSSSFTCKTRRKLYRGVSVVLAPVDDA